MRSAAERHRQTRRLVRGAKLVSCFMVGGAVLCSSVIMPQHRYGIWGELGLIALWVMNYYVLTSVLATNQRLVMMQRIIDAHDYEAMERFSKVSLRMHLFALLLWLDPVKLYKPDRLDEHTT
jgi:hypothetical protein